jgi:hypothetical protein
MLSHADLAVIAQNVYRGPWSGLAALDVKYSLLPRDDELVVAVPGTDPENAFDLLRDARALPSWIPGLGTMHSGFGKGAEAVWRIIDGEMRHNSLVTYVGHSLGASIAQCLAGLHAVNRPRQLFRFVGFGTPRTAWINPYFRRLLRRGFEAVEYRNAGDPIVSVPPRLTGYLHGADGQTLGSALADPLSNHAMGLYVSRMK